MCRLTSATVLVGIAALITAPEAQAQEAQGFAELRASFFPGASGQTWQLVQRARPTFEATVQERIKLVATIEASLAEGRSSIQERARILAALPNANACELPTHENDLFRIDGVSDYLAVDRLYVDAYLDAVDLRVGRQALNWGSAQFFNPTDPFPEVLLAEPWRPRAGVNAARATIPFGALNDVSAVVASNDTFDALRAAGRVRVNWLDTDFALVGAWRGDTEQGLVGLDLRGTLGVGFWVEAAYLFGTNPHEEIAAGIDYSFDLLERATLLLQYYRNGSDSSGTLEPLVNLDCNVSTPDPFAPFVSGKNYLLVAGSIGIDSDLSLIFTAVQSLDDGTAFLVPTVTHTVADWLDASISAQVPVSVWGSGGEFRPSDPLLGRLVPDATLTFWTRASF